MPTLLLPYQSFLPNGTSGPEGNLWPSNSENGRVVRQIANDTLKIKSDIYIERLLLGWFT